MSGIRSHWRPASVALCFVLVAPASACSGSVSKDDLTSPESVITGLTVSGEPGTAPGVRMRTPLEIDETATAVTVTGTGAPIQVDQLFVLELTLYDARTGKLALSTYDTGTAIAAKSSDDRLFPALSEALVGVRQGSRLVLAATSADAFATSGVPPKGVERGDPVVVVADVVAVPPTTVLEAADGLPATFVPGTPELFSPDGVPTRLNFDQAGPEPDKARRTLLLGGTGPKVPEHGLVTVDYFGQDWQQSEPFESTYFKEPALVAIGTGTAPAGWDEQLVGVPVGSRVMIVVPPGTDPRRHGTIVWVVDVLGVS